MYPRVQYRWIGALFLCVDGTLWRVGAGRGREKASLAGIVELFICAGDQTSKEVSFGGCGTAADMGFTGGLQKAIEGGRTEREYQYIICGTDQPNDTAERFEIDTAHMGKGTVHAGAFGTSVLVVGLLSLLTLSREFADENGRADSSQGETETERI